MFQVQKAVGIGVLNGEADCLHKVEVSRRAASSASRFDALRSDVITCHDICTIRQTIARANTTASL